MPTEGYDAWKRSGPPDPEPSGYLCEYCKDHLFMGERAVRSIIGELFHPDCWEDFQAEVDDHTRESDQRYWKAQVVVFRFSPY